MKQRFLHFAALSLLVLASAWQPARAGYWKTVTEGHTTDPAGLGRLQWNEPEDSMYIVLQYGITPAITGYLTIDDASSYQVAKLYVNDPSVNTLLSVWQLEWDALGTNTTRSGASLDNDQFYLRNYATGEYLCAADATQGVNNPAPDYNSVRTTDADIVRNTIAGVTSDKSKALRFSFAKGDKYPWNTGGPNSGPYNAQVNPEYKYSTTYYNGEVAVAMILSDGTFSVPSNPLALAGGVSEMYGPLTQNATRQSMARAIKYGNTSATRTWSMYQVQVITGGANILRALLDTYTEQGYTPSNYRGGNAPGEYDPAAAQTFANAWNACLAGIAAGDATSEDDAATLQADLALAQQAVASTQKPVTDGYYYLQSAYGYAQPVAISAGNDLNSSTALQFAPLAQNDASFIFNVRSAGTSNSFTVQNFANDYYLNVPRNGSHAALTLAPTNDQKIIALPSAGEFSLSNTVSSTQYYAVDTTQTTGNVSLTATAASDGAAAWRLVPVDSATIASLQAEVTQNKLNLTLARLIGEAEDEVQATDTIYAIDLDNPYVTDASQFSTNAPEVTTNPDQSIGNLMDGDVTTYFHSRWSRYTADETEPTEPHYICVYLADGTERDAVSFRFVPSPNSNFPNNYPTRALITGSTDSLVWDTLATLSIPIISQQGSYVSRPIALSKSYNYLKFSVLETPNGHSSNGQTTLQYAEFNWYDSQIDDRRSASLRADTRDELTALKQAIATARGVTTATEADVAALQQALDAFLAVYPDVSALMDEQTKATALADNAIVSEGVLSYYNSDAVLTLQQAIATNGGTSDELSLLTRAQINERLATLQAAELAFEWGFNKPEGGKTYRIQAAGTSARFVTQNNLVTGGNNHYSTQTEDEITNKAASYFRFVPASDSTYYIQSVNSGFFFNQVKSQLLSRTNVQVRDSLEFVLLPNRHGGFIISNADRTGSLENEVADRSISTHPYTNSTNGSTLNDWIVTEVPADEAVGSKDFLYNEIQIVTLPYALRALPSSTTAPVSAYHVVGVTKDAQGSISQLKLAIYAEGETIAAGQPFVIEAGSSSRFDPTTTDTVTVQLPVDTGALCNASREANGLVGVFASTRYAGTDGAYFTAAQLTPMTASTVIAPQSGYVKMLSVEDESAPYNESDLLIVDVNGEPIVNAIHRALVAGGVVNVYSVDGVLVRRNVQRAEATRGLPAGLYIVGGRKLLVK